MADFPILIRHVETASPEIYRQTRPLTAVAEIAKLDGVGVSRVRSSLYMARDNAEDPEVKARFAELIEYLRFDH